ncbi:MAG: tRNA uracil 4-sulfurtransferase ThiI [bacterium JZ-2024 1]
MAGKSREADTRSERWKAVGWSGAVFHYDEIALKKGFRRTFARLLEKNLRNVLSDMGVHVFTLGDRILARCSSETAWVVAELGARIFGIAYSAPVREIPRDIESLQFCAIQVYRAVASPSDSVAVRIRRVDKFYPMSKNELARQIGQAVVDATRAPVSLDAPSVTLEFRIYKDSALFVGPRMQGPGGLPVGVQPKVLCLFSGGLDSPIAAYLMMRRGTPVDFLHFHTFPSADSLKESKIIGLVNKLVAPQGVEARLFLVPDYLLSMALVKAQVSARWHLIILRRFMLRVANTICDRYGHHAIVTGDSLGQVASQTLENLAGMDAVAGRPILRPLIGTNKREIVDLSRRLGLYSLSILPYKDCCSLVAGRAALKPNLNHIRAAEQKMEIETIVNDTVRESATWTVGPRGLTN